MTEDQAKQMIELLKALDSKLTGIYNMLKTVVDENDDNN